MPIDPAFNIIRELLEKSVRLWDRPVLSVQNKTDLFGFSLHNTYFSSQNKFYKQVEGTAMVSSGSPTVANMYMEYTASTAQALI